MRACTPDYGLYLRESGYRRGRRKRSHPDGHHDHLHSDHHPDLQYAQRYRQGKAANDSVHHLYARKDRNLLDFCKYARGQHSGRDGRLADLLCSYLRGGNVPARQVLGDCSELLFNHNQTAYRSGRKLGSCLFCQQALRRSYEPQAFNHHRNPCRSRNLYCNFI